MMNRIRPRSPIIPGDTTDRTGSGPVQRRAIKAIRQRWAGLTAEVLAIFARIRVIGEVAQNDTSGTPRTIYALTPEELAAVTQALREAFDRWIEAVAGGSYRTHWYAQIDADAAQLGLAQTVANLTALSATYSASRNIGAALMSQGFQNRVAMAQIKSYAARSRRCRRSSAAASSTGRTRAWWRRRSPSAWGCRGLGLRVTRRQT